MSRRFKIILTLCVVAFAATLFLFSPFFYVREINVSGNSIVSREEILERVGADFTTNLMFFNFSAARKRVVENLYIADIIFTRDLPGRLYIEVRERRVAAFVEHTPGSFLYIDEHGRVLEIRPMINQPLPIVTGLNFTRFALGEVLEVPDRTAFSIVTRYAQLIYRHGLAGRVTNIDVSDTANTRIFIGDVEFIVGGIHDADAKVRDIVGLLPEFEEAGLTRGYVDIRVIRDVYFFVITT